MADLFGNPDPPVKTPLELKRERQRKASKPKGYAAPPGSGPPGETCGSCRHHYKRQSAGVYHKCDLLKPTKGPGTDIRVRSPACSRWEKKA